MEAGEVEEVLDESADQIEIWNGGSMIRMMEVYFTFSLRLRSRLERLGYSCYDEGAQNIH